LTCTHGRRWGTEWITVYVGPERREFKLHKLLVCTKSPYFDKCFNGNFAEAKTAECRFPEDDSSAFEIFMNYLYTGQVPKDCSGITASERTDTALVSFYLLADKLLLPNEAKTSTINSLISWCKDQNSIIGPVAGQLVLNSTAEHCPLRRLVVDMVCWNHLLANQVPDDSLQNFLTDVNEPPYEYIFATIRDISFGDEFEDPFWHADTKKSGDISKIERYQIGYLKVENSEEGAQSRGATKTSSMKSHLKSILGRRRQQKKTLT
jgi:BTB/POZ domain